MDAARTLVVIQAVAAFTVVAALWSLGVLLWKRRGSGEREVIARRLGEAGTAGPDGAARTLRLWRDGEEVSTRVPGRRVQLTRRQRFERLCRDAGVTTPGVRVAQFLGGGTVCLALLLLLVTGRVAPALAGAAALPLVAWAVLRKRAVARQRLFERQFVDALELSSRALRAGHPLMASFQLISTEIPAPVGNVFAGVVQQQALGVGLDESLRRAAAENGSPDLDLFTAAISIHTRSGGNLADVMQSLALVIRERMRLGRRFRVLVAQTQVSKRILIAMPCVMFGVLNLVGPTYMETLYVTAAGNALLLVSACSLATGWFVMNRMTDLRA